MIVGTHANIVKPWQCTTETKKKKIHYVLLLLNRIIYIWELPVYTILHEFFSQRQVLNMWRLSRANLQHSADE